MNKQDKFAIQLAVVILIKIVLILILWLGFVGHARLKLNDDVVAQRFGMTMPGQQHISNMQNTKEVR